MMRGQPQQFNQFHSMPPYAQMPNMQQFGEQKHFQQANNPQDGPPQGYMNPGAVDFSSSMPGNTWDGNMANGGGMCISTPPSQA
jgi:hypothetical protein